MTPEDIAQTPPEACCDEEIKTCLPEAFLQLMEEDVTSSNGISKDSTNVDSTSKDGINVLVDGTGKDEVNTAQVVCTRCEKNKLATQYCPRCQQFFCDFCWLVHHKGKCKGYTGTYQDMTEVSHSLKTSVVVVTIVKSTSH